ncbi:MAG: FAD-dependent monooxygenase [Pseudonocardia sp.]|nr:FAD-dependent monooxygenase [Pseudonocardia sp.]
MRSSATAEDLFVRDPANAHIEPGEILVAPTTDPGHDPVLAAPERFAALATAHGITFATIDDRPLRLINGTGGVGDTVARGIRGELAVARAMPSSFGAVLDDAAMVAIDDAGAGADVIVQNGQIIAAPHLGEQLGVPVVLTLTVPLYVPTSAFPWPGQALPAWLPGPLNRASYLGMHAPQLMFAGVVDRWRAERLGLPAHRSRPHRPRRRTGRTHPHRGRNSGGRRPAREHPAEGLVTMVKSVLVVGAGIAGSTLALRLGQAGIDTTVVEHDAGQRSSGNPVDVRGLAVPLAEQIGLLEALNAAATHTVRLAAVNSRGGEIGWIPAQTGPDGFEIPRSDLTTILQTAAGPYARFRRGDTVTALQDHGHDGVEVHFRATPPDRFDLVIGADGLHSQVRRLAFGPEQQFATPLGMYIATSMLDGAAADPRTVLLHNAPGRAVAVHPGTGREGAAFIFRAPPAPAAADPRRLLTSAYGDMGWRVPELLDHACHDEQLWFDTVSRVDVPCWSQGRIVLVGDAAGCISLFGEGSSMAVVGAATLTQALTAHPDDLPVALAHYEHSHRARLRHHHRGATFAAHLLVPATRIGTGVRDTAFHAWSTLTRVRP